MCIRHPRSGRRGAFTLLELLAVVGIIGLLVALLVPAVSAIRTNAKRTATSSTLNALATGLEVFKADQRVGGAYPPSFTDNGSDKRVSNPYKGPLYQGFGNRIEITGAGLLVWALAGPDRLGSAGFRKVRPASDEWSDDTDNDFRGSSALDGLYALYPSGHAKEGQPVYPRSGPYVDIEKTQMTPYNERLRSFISKAESDARRGQALPDRRYPTFLDSFGFPILYYRADPAGQKLADRDQFDPSQPPQGRGIYHWLDNQALVSGASALQLRPGADRHQLEWDPNSSDVNNPPQPRFFQGYIRNNDVKAKLAPQKADSFLLITAGEDGVYGTGDDIANFQHNGR